MFTQRSKPQMSLYMLEPLPSAHSSLSQNGTTADPLATHGVHQLIDSAMAPILQRYAPPPPTASRPHTYARTSVGSEFVAAAARTLDRGSAAIVAQVFAATATAAVAGPLLDAHQSRSGGAV